MSLITASPSSAAASGAVAAPDAAIGIRPEYEPDLLAHRVITLCAVLGLFGAAFATWATAVQVPLTAAISVAGFAGALTLAAMTVTAHSARRLRQVDVAVLLLALLLLSGWALSNLFFQPAYGTDEAAFEQFAATLLAHGHDPYGANLLPALSQFRVPVQYATYTLDGHAVSTLGYPALPVLLVTALLPVTRGVQTVVILNVVVLAIATVAMWRLLPARWRALAPLMTVGLPILFGYTVSGVNAVIAMALLIGVAHRWERVGAGGRFTHADTARALCLGLACATQQLPWFIVPFLLSGIYLLRAGNDGHRVACRVLARYGATGAAAFAAVNLPFIVWNPGAWAAGVLAPLTQHAIPYGQGVIDLTLFFHLGGGDLRLYTLAGAAIYLATFVGYLLAFRRAGRACFILPAVALFFPTRSLAEYFMILVAVWVMSAASVEAAPFAHAARAWLPATSTPGRRTLIGATALVLSAPGVALLAAAVTAPAPLALSITSVQTTGQLQSVWEITVHATNRTRAPLTPHFAANYTGQATTFWNVLDGPATLPAHGEATYTLAAPNTGSMPGIHTPFLLQAVTAVPQTISSTRLYTPQPYSTAIVPGYVNQVLPAGASINLTVELRSPFGAVIHKAGVPVALGQLIYGQNALIPGQANINNQGEGRSPVIALTDPDGLAHFRLTDQQPQNEPLSFQAWVQPTDGYPYGYSPIVNVLWRPAA